MNLSAKCLSYPFFDSTLPEQLITLPGSEKENLLEELILLYRSNSFEIIKNIESAFSSKNAASLTKLCHTLKSSSGTLGLAQLQHICEEIEKNAAVFIGTDNVGFLQELKLAHVKGLEELNEFFEANRNKEELR